MSGEIKRVSPKFIQDIPKQITINDHSFFSPINLKLEEMAKIELPELKWINMDSEPISMKVANTGQTVIVSASWVRHRPRITGGPLLATYAFSQLHYHWGTDNTNGSEHSYNNKKAPLEMHAVFLKEDCRKLEEALNEKDGAIVISYAYKLDAESNPGIKLVCDELPLITNPSQLSELDCPVKLTTFVVPFINDYFIYWGSVRTNACKHVLLWILCRQPYIVSQRQLDTFRALFTSGHQPLMNHSRTTHYQGYQAFHVNPSAYKEDVLYKQAENNIKRLVTSTEKTRGRQRNRLNLNSPLSKDKSVWFTNDMKEYFKKDSLDRMYGGNYNRSRSLSPKSTNSTFTESSKDTTEQAAQQKYHECMARKTFKTNLKDVDESSGRRLGKHKNVESHYSKYFSTLDQNENKKKEIFPFDQTQESEATLNTKSDDNHLEVRMNTQFNNNLDKSKSEYHINNNNNTNNKGNDEETDCTDEDILIKNLQSKFLDARAKLNEDLNNKKQIQEQKSLKFSDEPTICLFDDKDGFYCISNEYNDRADDAKVDFDLDILINPNSCLTKKKSLCYNVKSNVTIVRDGSNNDKNLLSSIKHMSNEVVDKEQNKSLHDIGTNTISFNELLSSLKLKMDDDSDKHLPQQSNSCHSHGSPTGDSSSGSTLHEDIPDHIQIQPKNKLLTKIPKQKFKPKFKSCYGHSTIEISQYTTTFPNGLPKHEKLLHQKQQANNKMNLSSMYKNKSKKILKTQIYKPENFSRSTKTKRPVSADSAYTNTTNGETSASDKLSEQGKSNSCELKMGSSNGSLNKEDAYKFSSISYKNKFEKQCTYSNTISEKQLDQLEQTENVNRVTFSNSKKTSVSLDGKISSRRPNSLDNCEKENLKRRSQTNFNEKQTEYPDFKKKKSVEKVKDRLNTSKPLSKREASKKKNEKSISLSQKEIKKKPSSPKSDDYNTFSESPKKHTSFIKETQETMKQKHNEEEEDFDSTTKSRTNNYRTTLATVATTLGIAPEEEKFLHCVDSLALIGNHSNLLTHSQSSEKIEKGSSNRPHTSYCSNTENNNKTKRPKSASSKFCDDSPNESSIQNSPTETKSILKKVTLQCKETPTKFQCKPLNKIPLRTPKIQTAERKWKY